MSISRITGEYQTLGTAKHFIPFPLPAKNPPLALNQETMELYSQALLNLGSLNGRLVNIPNKERFLRAYIIKEALLSSKIENIHTTLLEVFTFIDETTKPNKQTQLVLNYTNSLSHAVHLLNEGLPLSSRVMCESHGILLSHGSGHANPGSFRKQQVSVGNLIPAPAPLIPQLMSDLDNYINEQNDLPLIKAGLAHVQFETIHPFLDGNGRIGRQLIVLILLQDKLLTEPILYPSYYFKKHHAEYYARLDAVRTTGDFESWIQYYLHAIAESAHDAILRIAGIEHLEQNIKKQITENDILGKNKTVALELLSALFNNPVLTVQEAAGFIGKTANTARTLINNFVTIGILKPLTEQKRNQRFVFQEYLDVLEKEF